MHPSNHRKRVPRTVHYYLHASRLRILNFAAGCVSNV